MVKLFRRVILKKNRAILLLLLFLAFPLVLKAQEYKVIPRESLSGNTTSLSQRWGFYTGVLIQNAPFREFSATQFNNIAYAKQFSVWGSGKAGTGTYLGFVYDKTFKNNLVFRVQGQFESAGWLSGILDIGLGVRTPLGKGMYFNIEAYFSILQTGGSLKRLGADSNYPDSVSVYMGMFGFKGRIALEFDLPKNMYIAPYLSYVAYPWQANTLNGELRINGLSQSSLVDSLQIGLEVGSKF